MDFIEQFDVIHCICYGLLTEILEFIQCFNSAITFNTGGSTESMIHLIWKMVR